MKRTYEISVTLKVGSRFQNKMVKELERIPNFTCECARDKKNIHIYGIFEKGHKMDAARQFYQVCAYYNCSLQLPLEFRRDYGYKNYKQTRRNPDTEFKLEPKKTENTAAKQKCEEKMAKFRQKPVKKTKKVGFFRYLLNYWR